MPHIVVKLWPGQSAQAKQRVTDEIVESVTRAMNYGPDSVSVGFEEVSPSDWMDGVYQPDIAAKWATLTKKPGYGPDRVR